MVTTVTGRDGIKKPFDSFKIYKSILSAMRSVGKVEEKDLSLITRIVDSVSNRLREGDTVETIQDLTIHYLQTSSRKDVARSFIEYSERRRLARGDERYILTFKEHLSGEHDYKQNANLDEMSFSGRIGESSSAVCKELALQQMTNTSKVNHINNLVYIHDLDSWCVGRTNCLTVPFDKLLYGTPKIGNYTLRSAKSVTTACSLIAVYFQCQSLQQFGGVAASHIDWTMVPAIRWSFAKHYVDGLKYIVGVTNEEFLQPSRYADIPVDDPNYKMYIKAYNYAVDKTREEIRSSVDALYHNLNTLMSRSGAQLPFTSVNFGTCTLEEGRWFIKEALAVSRKGIGKYYQAPIFPCVIFQVGKGINKNPNDPNYDLYLEAIKTSAKCDYPNFANIDWSGNKGYDKTNPNTYFSSMGCRTANGVDINATTPELKQLKDGRGNLSPVTLILPTIAMLCKQEGSEHYDLIDRFFRALDVKISEAKDTLIERYKIMCTQSPKAARFMYENGLFTGFDGESLESALKHGTLAIGQLGLAECLQILIGCDHTTPFGMSVAKRIESLFKTRCAEFKRELKLNFGVYYSPAESLCYTAMNKFKKQFGIIPNVSDKDYFTNSIHVPVWKKISAFEKIDIESQLTGYSSAGCITYVELPETIENNPEALHTLVDYAMDKDIPYFAINRPLRYCKHCHKQVSKDAHVCECGSEDFYHIGRVTGYLSIVEERFNKGKKEEFGDREVSTDLDC